MEQAGFGEDRYAKVGPPNGVLDVGIDDDDVVIDVDLTGTGMDADDWRTGGEHQVRIGDEVISYTTVTDNAGSSADPDVIRLTGVTRDSGAVAHLAGADVVILYSAASDRHRERYGFIGSAGDPPDGNLLDGDGDLVGDVAGYLNW